ncbi:MAG: formate dehydrogenase accessory sulfurtransferase FdhD [Oscillibacter sp.]|nr:formate dehydrogenase accessory sulfurtransferase FdhD [Oscillibacter sp.]
MKIVNAFRGADGAELLPVLRVDAEGERDGGALCAAAEHVTEVFVNGAQTMRLICSPTQLPELVLGRLLTEGLISCADDVEHLSVCEYGTRVSVLLRESAPQMRAASETVPTCCTDNRVFFSGGDEPRPVKPLAWKKEWIFALARELANAPPIYRKTHSVHGALLMRNGELLYRCEDLGRHNAADKAIGCALRDGVPLEECILFSTGRLPTDMVRKVIRAGIPVLASKASATDAAAELAERFGVTLLLMAREDSFLRLAAREDRA